MKQSLLSNGEKIYVVRVEHFVKLRDFATALTDKYYCNGEIFNESLTKKEAERILRYQLFFYGLNGMHETDYFASSYNEGEKYNSIYRIALLWIKQKYPYYG